VILRREGHEVRHRRLLHICSEAPLQVSRRDRRKRAMGKRAPMVLPMMPDQSSLQDHVSDQLTHSR